MVDSRRVVVTGLSVMAANGRDKNEFLQHSAAGLGGIRKNSLFPTKNLRTDYFGQINCEYIYEVEKLSQESRLESIFADLMDDLYLDAGLTQKMVEQKREKAGFSFATSVGVNDYVTAHVKGRIQNSISKSNIYKLPEKLGIKGPIFINTSACSAGTTAIGTGFSLILSGEVDFMIAGGIDPLTEFSSYGFHSLQNLSSSPCRPFDRNRDGITLGEGGALFVLEDYTAALKRGAYIYGEILGYGLGNDAYHATSPDPSGAGAIRVMNQALKQSRIAKEQIDYVNAHGTGTQINDSMEFKAIQEINSTCLVSSTKSHTGHCLAAAGAVEFAAVLLSIENELIFANLNLEEALDGDRDQKQLVSNTLINQKVNYALSNSFAFAGNAASLAVRRGVDVESMC